MIARADRNRFDDVSLFIENAILHSEVWDSATVERRKKAVNHSIHTIRTLLKKWIPVDKDIPVDVLAHQTVWLLRIDDTFLRADMGISYIQMAGVMVTLKDRDRSISPVVLDILNITPCNVTGGLPRRKTGSYHSKYEKGKIKC